MVMATDSGLVDSKIHQVTILNKQLDQFLVDLTRKQKQKAVLMI